jgi:drug/metabolite transporter (DMT)-like permease
MVLGAWLLSEQMTSHGVIGAVVVMAGAWLGALSPDARRSVPVRTVDPMRTVLDSG